MSGGPGLCTWCGHRFPARRGGSPRSFCSSGCRTAFHTAARRWAEHWIAAGVLTIADIRNGISNGDGTACTLPPGVVSPASIPEARKGAGEPPQSADAAATDLLDELLCALVDLPGGGYADIMTAIPEPLYDKLDAYIEERLEEADSQP